MCAFSVQSDQKTDLFTENHGDKAICNPHTIRTKRTNTNAVYCSDHIKNRIMNQLITGYSSSIAIATDTKEKTAMKTNFQSKTKNGSFLHSSDCGNLNKANTFIASVGKPTSQELTFEVSTDVENVQYMSKNDDEIKIQKVSRSEMNTSSPEQDYIHHTPMAIVPDSANNSDDNSRCGVMDIVASNVSSPPKMTGSERKNNISNSGKVDGHFTMNEKQSPINQTTDCEYEAAQSAGENSPIFTVCPTNKSDTLDISENVPILINKNKQENVVIPNTDKENSGYAQTLADEEVTQTLAKQDKHDNEENCIGHLESEVRALPTVNDMNEDISKTDLESVQYYYPSCKIVCEDTQCEDLVLLDIQCQEWNATVNEESAYESDSYDQLTYFTGIKEMHNMKDLDALQQHADKSSHNIKRQIICKKNFCLANIVNKDDGNVSVYGAGDAMSVCLTGNTEESRNCHEQNNTISKTSCQLQQLQSNGYQANHLLQSEPYETHMQLRDSSERNRTNEISSSVCKMESSSSVHCDDNPGIAPITATVKSTAQLTKENDQNEAQPGASECSVTDQKEIMSAPLHTSSSEDVNTQDDLENIPLRRVSANTNLRQLITDTSEILPSDTLSIQLFGSHINEYDETEQNIQQSPTELNTLEPILLAGSATRDEDYEEYERNHQEGNCILQFAEGMSGDVAQMSEINESVICTDTDDEKTATKQQVHGSDTTDKHRMKKTTSQLSQSDTQSLTEQMILANESPDVYQPK